MSRFWGCVLVAGITLVFCAHAVAAGGKIGYLDPYGAIAQSQWGKKVQEDLKKEQEQIVSAVEQKKQAFITARDDYLKKKDALDAKARDRKEKELADMMDELSKLQYDSQNKISEQQRAAIAPLSKKVVEIATKIAKDDKYDFIIDKNVLIVPPDSGDITSRVVSELDKSGPPK